MKKVFYVTIGFLLIACNFLTPYRPKNEVLLIGRHPEEWMPNYTSFVAIDDVVPIYQRFGYPNELDGITSYGYVWAKLNCDKSISSSIYSGEVFVIIYNSNPDAQAKLANAISQFKNGQSLQKEENVNLRTGNTATISFFQYTDCNSDGYYAGIIFRRNNVLGFVNVATFQNYSEGSLREIVLDLGSQLDQIIQNEITNHPGNNADLAEITNSARTIDERLSSDTISPTDNLSDPMDYLQGEVDCYGNDFYTVSGVLTNISDNKINVDFTWGPSPSDKAGGGVSNFRSRAGVVIFPGERKNIYLSGNPVITDIWGDPYPNCEIYYLTPTWSD